MRICERHWAALREEVRKRGMAPLVTRNGREALEHAVKDMLGLASESEYDPLMDCCFMITSRAISLLGLSVFNVGNACPLCEVLNAHDAQPCEHGCTREQVEQRWLDGPANAALQYCQESPVLRLLLESTST